MEEGMQDIFSINQSIDEEVETIVNYIQKDTE